MHDFDLLVIGSGPAGEKAAVQAAYFGKRVGLIERAPVLGGASANTGTLPSKTLRETAVVLSGMRARAFRALHVHHHPEMTVEDFLYRERLVMENERDRIAKNLQAHNVTLLHGEASFLNDHTLCVDHHDGTSRRYTADVIVIATGSSPYRPPQFPFEDPRVFDSDEIVSLEKLPKSLVVAGGGVIGCEYACLFAALGTKVTLTEQKDSLLGFLDREIVQLLQRSMQESLCIDVKLSCNVQTLTLPPGNTDSVNLTFTDGSQLTVDAVLIASGRSGNTEKLKLECAGLKANARGQIPVDEHYRTVRSNIYAVGDVIGFPALGSTSMEQGRIAVVHAFDLKYKSALAKVLPYGIYTIPEVSMAGDTEESLSAAGIPYVVGRHAFSRSARGSIIGEQTGMLKLLFRQQDLRLLGVHVLGEQATELVHIGLVALLAGANADFFIQTCFNYPTLSEAYKYATYDALGRADD